MCMCDSARNAQCYLIPILCLSSCMFRRVYLCVCTFIYMCIHTCTQFSHRLHTTCTNTKTYKATVNVCVRVNGYLYICLHSFMYLRSVQVCVRAYVYKYKFVYVRCTNPHGHMHAHAHMRTLTHVYKYVRVNVCLMHA